MLFLSPSKTLSSTTDDAQEDFYSFTANDIDGNPVSLAKYRGKVSLIVNVASECGYTDNHYRGMVLLQQTFGHTDKFNVLAFPCNQFGEQEPGSNKEIYQFAHDEMEINFPLFAKINVRDKNVHPAWLYLSTSSEEVPRWNFYKYLVDHNGHVIDVWGPQVDPEDLSQEIQKAISNIYVAESRGKDEF
ncbi:glutathione peroxidase [Plakobranchus ocellatus]|uniref:Glutathione peroxidase n=1 Tax=Plakobranchus ocellatus TaxID=259542 RepID=A0AAV4B2N1_9GAST|nr:glutathione peroxidase [Plakobranchus ocellatus]